MDKATVEAKVGGETFTGFENASIDLTMESPYNSFEFEYSLGDSDQTTRRIYTQDECEIVLGDEVLIAGYVETTDDEDDVSELSLSAAGRSRPADIADVSPVNKPGSWKGALLSDIVRDLCSPYDFSVSVDGDEGAKFPHFSTHDDATIYDAVARAASMRGKVVYSVGGDLVLARAGTTTTDTVLERGGQLITSARHESTVGRYSEYRYRGQARATDETWGEQASSLKEVVLDEGIKRYRPLRVEADAHDGLDLKTRAELERNQRAGQSERLTCTVESWTNAEGYIWRPNTLVRVVNPVLGVDASLLIVALRFRIDAYSPQHVEMELTRPEAFDLGQYPALTRGEQWR